MLSARAWDVQTTSTGEPVLWQGFPVRWSRSPGTAPLPEGGARAVEAAFEAWSGPGRAVEFVPGERAEEVPEPVHDWRNDVWMVSEWPFQDPALARAVVWTDPAGHILSFDILVDGAEDWTTDEEAHGLDLQSAVTHEVGHALGLGHSEAPEAVMWPVAAAGVLRRALSADDLEAVRELYPPAPSEASCSAGGAAARGPAWWAGALLVARRRRSR